MNREISDSWRELVKYRIPHVHNDFPLVLFWSQKSGCTTLAKWFYEQIGLLEEALEYSPWIHAYEDEVYKSKTDYRSEAFERIMSGEKDGLKLVRNPYKRAASQFLILATTKGLYWDGEWEKIRTIFYGNKDSPRGITFKQFLCYVRDYPEITDNHFHPQYSPGEEKFIQKHVKLENFHKEIGQIEKQYGLKRTKISELSNSSHHLKNSMVLKGDYANAEITNESFALINKFPTYESFYDDEAIHLVNTVFENDFTAYGYKMKKI